MRNPIIIMSITGGAMFLIYLLLKPLLKCFFSARTRMGFIIVSIFFYLFPLPLFKHDYYNLIFVKLLGVEIYNEVPLRGFYKIKDTILITQSGQLIFSNGTILLYVVTAIMIILFIVLMSTAYKAYRRLWQRVILTSRPAYTDVKTPHHARLLVSDEYEPMTMGFFDPLIVLPNRPPEDENIQFIIKHEFAHLKHKDFLVRMFIYAVICLHWFNILVYIMLREFNSLAEYYADEVCVGGMSEKELNAYMETVIEFSTEKGKKDEINERFTNRFGSNKTKLLTRRLISMKNVKKYSKYNFFIGCILIAATAFSCSLITFAYEEPPVYINSDFDYETEMYFTPDGSTEFFDEFATTVVGSVNTVFIDEAGNAYEVDDAVVLSENSPNATCSHVYVNGTIQKHISNGSGGCTVYIYNAQRCSKCGTVIQGSLISSTNYTVCPH